MKELKWRDILIRTALVLATMAIVVWCMPRDNRSYFHVEQGKPWKYAEFTAPYDFPIYKSEAVIQEERDSAMRKYEPYYNYQQDVARKMILKFETDYPDGISGLPRNFTTIIANLLADMYHKGILEQKDYTELRSDTAALIRVVSGKQAVSVSIADLYSPKTAYERLFMDSNLSAHRTILQKCNLNNYIVANLSYDRERSEASKNDLMGGIALASGVVVKGQKIVDRGEIVTEKTYRIIESFKHENELRNEDVKQNQLSLFGHILYVLILMIGFTVYLSLYRLDYFGKARIHVYIVPYAMVPIIIRIFMDSRTAFMTHVTMILICAVMLQHPFEFIVIETVAGLAAITSLRELTERSQLFKTAVIVTLACLAVNLALDWIHADALTQIDYNTYNYLLVNGIALLFAYPLLYIIEKAFGFTSDITLVELSNTNSALLRRMSEVAPGTFNHSIQVANLAGEIANKIGAKAQLVRTGALYHDIGKLSNPIYFTENQSGINPHESLSDIDSAQIIISHVTEGLRMADKYNLPKVIRDFISTHHGQGKAKYFYVHYHNEHPDEPVDDLLFTYPGPNPFTREQACLMMADTVEAASRSLPDYTEQSIRDLVERLIDTQVAEGYFRECPITFRDIQYAKTVLIEKLKTIYHTRISYPSEKK